MKGIKFVSVLLVGATVGCSNAWNAFTWSSSSSSSAPTLSKYDVNKYPASKTVCNPLGGGGGGSTDPQQGVQASLAYLQASQPRYSNVSDMIQNGFASSESLFFNQIDVPTRLFTEGFPLQTGGSIDDDQGNELIEYFSLRFETVLHLGPNDVEGDYQLGLLADDGAVWYLASDANSTDYQVVVDDDGQHPTQLGCGSVVHMTQATQLNMRLDYYQGPRYHIALIPIWRLVNSSQPPTESLCGQNGNDLYFDYNNNSAPEPAYNKLLADGWHPLTGDNYSLQSSSAYNPCTTGTPPVISNLAAVNETETTGHYVLNWDTDVPATDQAMITDTATNVQTLTTSDNVLRTSHSVELDGLAFGHTYNVQAISVSADLGKTISPVVVVTFR